MVKVEKEIRAHEQNRRITSVTGIAVKRKDTENETEDQGVGRPLWGGRRIHKLLRWEGFHSAVAHSKRTLSECACGVLRYRSGISRDKRIRKGLRPARERAACSADSDASSTNRERVVLKG